MPGGAKTFTVSLHDPFPISQTKLSTAVAMLREEDYTVHYVKVEQLGTGLQTTVKVLAPPGTSYSEKSSICLI